MPPWAVYTERTMGPKRFLNQIQNFTTPKIHETFSEFFYTPENHFDIHIWIQQPILRKKFVVCLAKQFLAQKASDKSRLRKMYGNCYRHSVEFKKPGFVVSGIGFWILK